MSYPTERLGAQQHCSGSIGSTQNGSIKAFNSRPQSTYALLSIIRMNLSLAKSSTNVFNCRVLRSSHTRLSKVTWSIYRSRPDVKLNWHTASCHCHNSPISSHNGQTMADSREAAWWCRTRPRRVRRSVWRYREATRITPCSLPTAGKVQALPRKARYSTN